MKIETVQHPPSADYQALIDGIRKHALNSKGIHPAEHYASFIREDDQIIAGIGCYIYLGCLSIEKLWVAPDFRGKGHAQNLLRNIEDLGREKGCRFATLCTTDWEALDFYLKQRYEIEFKREGYDLNSTYWLL